MRCANALVPVSPPAQVEPEWRPRGRPLATFVAQLIATDRRAPQTLARRRATPAEAVACYVAAAAL